MCYPVACGKLKSGLTFGGCKTHSRTQRTYVIHCGRCAVRGQESDSAQFSVIELSRASGQTLNAFGNRGVSRKQIGEADAAEQWRDDEQMRCGWRCLHWNAFRVGVKLLQCAGQRVGIAGKLGA